jgi:hypothetical protein
VGSGNGGHADGGGLGVGVGLEDGLVHMGGGADGSDDGLLEPIFMKQFWPKFSGNN